MRDTILEIISQSEVLPNPDVHSEVDRFVRYLKDELLTRGLEAHDVEEQLGKISSIVVEQVRLRGQ